MPIPLLPSRPLRAAALTAASLLSLVGASPALARTDVPVRQTVLPDGDIRYSVAISVGDGSPVEAALDTGSAGLRVLKAALAPARYAATTLHRRYPFGSGVRFEGVLARAVIAVGPARTDGAVPFQLVDHVGCVEERPDCPASRVSAQDYRIAGNGYPGQGFSAILGLALSRPGGGEGALNPLAEAGERAWILVLPRPGEAAPGHLIVDPDAADRAGFTSLKLDPAEDGAGWADAALPGCIVEAGGGARFCGRTMIDSGAPGLSVSTGTVDTPRPWGAGHRATLEIGGADGPVSVPFVSGEDRARRVLLHPPRRTGGLQISAGTLPFYSYAVLYDAKAGVMAFKPRAPAGG